MNTTLWKDVPGYNGVYQVSSDGRVRRAKGGKGATVGRILTPKRGTRGYVHVDLSIADVKRRWFIHRLVAMAFIGMPPFDGAIINHKNGIKTDNTAGNLEWVTYSGNALHAILTGLTVQGLPMRGELNGRAKLSTQQVAEIRALKGIVGARGLAQRYGVSRTAIQLIHQNKHWR